jgi:dCTP deaminase
MAFWSSETLKERIPADQLIIPYDPERVKHCAYEMGVGGEAFVTSKSSDGPRLSAGAQVEIPPGQFGLLITAEVVTVPPDAIGFISIRAGIKFRGLVNVSGFHVDPGFKGQLKFAVYNAGSQPIRLDQGQPIFMIWFCDLDDPTKDLYKPRTTAQNVITADDVSKIQGEVASPAELKKRIDDMKYIDENKIISIEKEQIIIRALLVAVILAGIGIFVKSLIEGESKSPQPASTAHEARVEPKVRSPVVTKPGNAPTPSPPPTKGGF